MKHLIDDAARLARWGLGAAALALGMTVTSPALAQTNGTAKQANGTTICTFSGFTYNSSDNTLSITCTDAPPPPPPCTSQASGTFSFWRPDSGATSGVSTTLEVTRSVAIDCAYNLTYTVSAPAGVTFTVNGSASPTGTVTFANQDYAVKTLPIIVNSTTNVAVTVTLSSAKTIPMGITPFATHTLYVTGKPNTGGVPGCEAYPAATYTDKFTVNGQKITYRLKPGETSATEVPLSAAAGSIALSTIETVNTPADADHQVVISRCPGDFTSVPIPSACASHFLFNGGTLDLNTGLVSPLQTYHCKGNPGTSYYVNIRQVKRDAPTLNSCNSGLGYCEVRLQIQGFQ